MIVLSAKARSGKTTFAAMNSFATLKDLITSNALFGSINFRGQHRSDAVSFRSNGQVPMSYFWPVTVLDKQSTYYDLQSIDLVVFPKMKDNQPKVQLAALDGNQVLEKKVISRLKKICTIDEGSAGLPIFDKSWYANRGSLEPFWVKKDDYFYMVYDQCLPFVHVVKDTEPICYVIRLLQDGDGQINPTIGSIIGVGFPAYIYNGEVYIQFALSHSQFDESVDFQGLPYINIAEAGPSMSKNYIWTAHGQSSYGKGRELRIFAPINPSKNWLDRIQQVFSTEDPGERIVNLVSRLATYGAISAAIRGFTNAAPPIVRFGLQAVPWILGGATVISVADFTFDMLQTAPDSLQDASVPADPIGLLLKTNRCFIDSIIDVLYGESGGATLTGGIPADVIRRFINTQLRECIGIYSALGGEKESDPFHSLATDAHMAGSYYFHPNKGYARELHFTTRNTNNRSIWYRLVDDRYLYGNCYMARKGKVDDITTFMTEGLCLNTIIEDQPYNRYTKSDRQPNTSSVGELIAKNEPLVRLF